MHMEFKKERLRVDYEVMVGYAWVVWHFLGNVKHCERVDVQLEECEKKEKTKGMVPLALMWIAWSEKNRRAIESVESSFFQLGSSLHSLFFFGCTQKVPSCIDDWVEFVYRESYRFVNSLLFSRSLV